jgi:hypothetical protein
LPISLTTFHHRPRDPCHFVGQSNRKRGGMTLAEERDYLRTAEIDSQHRLASLVYGLQGENRFGRTALCGFGRA